MQLPSPIYDKEETPHVFQISATAAQAMYVRCSVYLRKNSFSDQLCVLIFFVGEESLRSEITNLPKKLTLRCLISYDGLMHEFNVLELLLFVNSATGCIKKVI